MAWAILQTATLSVAVLVIARVFPDFCSARYRKGFFQGVFQGFVAVVRLPREKADCRTAGAVFHNTHESEVNHGYYQTTCYFIVQNQTKPDWFLGLTLTQAL